MRNFLNVVVIALIWVPVIGLAMTVIILASTQAVVREIAGETIRQSAQEEVRQVALEATKEEGTTSPDQALKNVGYPKTKDVLQSVQAVAATVGILGAAGWGLYIFVLGRSAAGTISIEIETKHVEKEEPKKAVVVSVKVTNVGRTLVYKELVQIRVMPIRDDELPDASLTLVEALLDPAERREYEIFRNPRDPEVFKEWEPGQDTVEDVKVNFGSNNRVRTEVVFAGRLFSLLDYRPFSTLIRAVGLGQRLNNRLTRRWYSRRICEFSHQVHKNLQRKLPIILGVGITRGGQFRWFPLGAGLLLPKGSGPSSLAYRGARSRVAHP